MTELETRIATLEKELAIARREAATAVTRAKEAELKEQAAAKQEEEPIPRVEALVNSLSGKVPFLCFQSNFLIVHPTDISISIFCRSSGQPTRTC